MLEAAEPDPPGFLLFHFPCRRTRSRPIRSSATAEFIPPNSSCDDTWFVLASCPDEVISPTPHHQTPHTSEAIKTGRDWPLMPTIRELCEPSVIGGPKCRMRLRAGLEICSTVHLAKGLLMGANALGGRAHQPPAISRRAAELAGI